MQVLYLEVEVQRSRCSTARQSNQRREGVLAYTDVPGGRRAVRCAVRERFGQGEPGIALGHQDQCNDLDG
jgi:hypothetical protein